MPNVVFDASSLVGALLRAGSVPERALLVTAATWVTPTEQVRDCRDRKDNKYLELALAAGATTIVSSDSDLLVLDPWRGIRIVLPTEYVRRFEGVPGGSSGSDRP